MVGKILAVKADAWDDHTYRTKPRPGDPYLSRASAHYPKDLICFLAKALINSAIGTFRKTMRTQNQDVPLPMNVTQEKLIFSTPL